MRLTTAGLAALIGLAFCPLPLFAQSIHSSSQVAPSVTVPRIISLSGEFQPADGRQPFPFETATFRIYADDKGGVPLWEETQTLAIDPSGRYTVLLGATQKDGVPVDAFMTGDARWLGITWSRMGEVEAPRSRLTSVPYALRAVDADTFGGLPPSAYQLAPMGGAGGGSDTGPKASGGPGSTTQNTTPLVVLPGTQNFMAKYVNSTDVGNSALYELNGLFGFNTNAPRDIIHSRFTNDDGQLTGIAVQNIGSGYSGMVFYDQLGTLAQFQGFNNTTHEYRINNIASGGSINFMLGGGSKFLVDATGKVLIGTTTPETGIYTQGKLEAASAASINGVTARKTVSSTFNAAIHARSDVGITGPVITGIAGLASNASVGGEMAILGSNYKNDISTYGIYGHAPGTNGIGVGGQGGLYAGQFSGNVTVTGTLSKGGGAFKIDHPVDPENKYLMHSFVESPDMMNIYNGNVTLDGVGEATITLPEWFEPLNRDYRYQLTAIGAPGPNLYVSQKIAGNQFRISGGSPGAEVSWQVTGIRQDAWANAHRIPTEVAKAPNEVGKYLHPKARGLGAEKAIVPAGLTGAIEVGLQ